MFLEVATIFGNFSLTQNEEEVWPGGIPPMLLLEPSFVCVPIFKPVIPFPLLAKVSFSPFFKKKKKKKKKKIQNGVVYAYQVLGL